MLFSKNINIIINYMAEQDLFDVVNSVILKFPLMICNFPRLFSHSKNIKMSTLITVIIIYYLLNIITIITKSHNNYCSDKLSKSTQG